MTPIETEQMAELQALVPDAQCFEEGGVTYVYLPVLKLPAGSDPPEVEGLLRPGAGPDGYLTRLFLSVPFRNKGQNWTEQRILEKNWHTPSFNDVPDCLRPIEILMNHLQVLR